MNSQWVKSLPSKPKPTGNRSDKDSEVKGNGKEPPHFDIMLEYWSDKAGFKRESLLSTDDSIETSVVAVPDSQAQKGSLPRHKTETQFVS